jgi:hypothetical protein
LIPVLVVVARVLMVLFLIRLGLRLLASVRRPRPAAPGDLVRDRVCNTFLPRERALTLTVDGRTEHFCSPACRERALHAAALLDSRAAAVQSHARNGGDRPGSTPGRQHG